MTKQTRLRALDNQVRRLHRRLVCLQRTSSHYSLLRLATFVAGLLAVGLALYLRVAWLVTICVVAAGLLFGLTVYAHRQVNESIRRHRVLLQIKSAQIARATLDWAHIPTTFSHRPQDDHPFEADLDLVGRRSLHRLLDTAVSYEGSQRLRDWLTMPIPDRPQVHQRQQLVRELIPLRLFRDKLILNATTAAGARKTWQANHLLDWLDRRTPEASLRLWLLLFGALAALNVALFVGNRLGLLPPWWQLTLVAHVGLWLVRTKATETAWGDALTLQGALQQLRAVLGQLETFSYHNRPGLEGLCAPFLDRAHRPSRYLVRITRIVAAMGLRENPLIGLALNALLPWDAYLAYRLNRTKATMAQHAPAWLDVWFELEALSALATFAYLNPSYTFPTLLGGERPIDLLCFR